VPNQPAQLEQPALPRDFPCHTPLFRWRMLTEVKGEEATRALMHLLDN
jgi:hypothetical protein